MTLEQLLSVFVERPPLDAEFDAFAAQCGNDARQTLNAVAIGVARKYKAGSLSYEEADSLMNSVYGYAIHRVMHKNEGLPDIMVRVYDAFDAGEYFHPGDAKDVDPVERYTRPMIDKVLNDQGAV